MVVDGEGFHGSTGAKVGARIRGDDAWFDDKLFSLSLGFPSHVLHGGGFAVVDTIPGSILNEDWGRDEIDALVEVEGLGGTFKSNTVKGYF